MQQEFREGKDPYQSYDRAIVGARVGEEVCSDRGGNHADEEGKLLLYTEKDLVFVPTA